MVGLSFWSVFHDKSRSRLFYGVKFVDDLYAERVEKIVWNRGGFWRLRPRRMSSGSSPGDSNGKTEVVGR